VSIYYYRFAIIRPRSERDLQFEPSARWEYSDYGFLLLGVLIEKVSGKSYYDFVAENIYQVAGMTNSGSEPEGVAVASWTSRGPTATAAALRE
jgi:CubicO group peptidase (beta-lactamase class C family)